MSSRAETERLSEALGQVFQDLSLAVLDHKFSMTARNLVDPHRALEAEIEELADLYDELGEVTRQINDLQGTSPAVLRAKLAVAFFFMSDGDGTFSRDAFEAIAGLTVAFRRPYVDRVEERLACCSEALKQLPAGA